VSGPDSTGAAARSAVEGLRPRDAGEARDAYARAVWSVITEPGDGSAGRLIAARGAAGALSCLDAGQAPPDGPSEGEWRTARARWLPRREAGGVAEALARARRAGVRLVVPGDDEWPSRLDDLGVHAPHCLWVRGELAGLSDAPSISVVGARAATGYGDHVARELSAELAASGVVVVSGAAYGIDGAAHRGALGAGGRTIAILAGGADRPYPAGHTELIARIAQTGAVFSETPCGTAPSKWRFLARNRLIAALGDATVVVEAGMRSGSLNTAAHAAELGRPLGAVPGPVTSAASAGCHRILREYPSMCVTGADDARELIGLTVRDVVAGADRVDDMTRLLDAMSTRVARRPIDIARASGMAVAEVETLLGLAALDRRVRGEGDAWLRTVSA
jgi:DNA processing protein